MDEESELPIDQLFPRPLDQDRFWSEIMQKAERCPIRPLGEPFYYSMLAVVIIDFAKRLELCDRFVPLIPPLLADAFQSGIDAAQPIGSREGDETILASKSLDDWQGYAEELALRLATWQADVLIELRALLSAADYFLAEQGKTSSIFQILYTGSPAAAGMVFELGDRLKVLSEEPNPKRRGTHLKGLRAFFALCVKGDATVGS